MPATTETGLIINNLALAETTYLFSSLAMLVFEHSVPEANKLNVRLGLTTMTPKGRPFHLSSRRPSRYFPDRGNVAPGDGTVVSGACERKSLDAGTISYDLLAGLYAWFGFEADQMPYVDRVGPVRKIDPARILSQAD